MYSFFYVYRFDTISLSVPRTFFIEKREKLRDMRISGHKQRAIFFKKPHCKFPILFHLFFFYPVILTEIPVFISPSHSFLFNEKSSFLELIKFIEFSFFSLLHISFLLFTSIFFVILTRLLGVVSQTTSRLLD